ncbi:MAG: alpha/beta fold hydrolase [Thermoleophilaceae bacterium]|nr:alpha/beta fold hydrolase [Thermoleophilaceae bacterium]
MKLLLPTAALVAGLLAAPAVEAASLDFKPCDEFGFSCARLKVPLDRTGTVPGRVSLFVKRRPSANKPSRGVLIAFAGGPGQSATRAFQGQGGASISAAARNRDLVIYDQRGTGRSGLLRCPRLERINILHAGDEAADCAKRLGPRRAFYTSRDTAGDVEALRKRLRVDKVSLYGVSYGTRSALSYALRHPNRVDRLVLDSVVEPDGVDALYRSTFAAVGRVLRTLCRRACDSFTEDPVDDVRALVAQMAGGTLRGTWVDARGRRHPAAIGGFDVLSVLVTGDFDPALRAAFPGAVRAAREGDLAPLIRLGQRANALEGGPFDPRALSSALYAATTCEEAELPWERGAPFGDRRRQGRATVEAIPGPVFTPFDRSTALGSDFVELCGRWPEARSAPVPGPGPLPDVPTLIINGADDLRTPVESARAVAAMLPRSRLLVLPGIGHSALSVDPTGCAARAYARFLNGGRPPARCRGVRRVTPEQPPPTRLRDVAPAPGVPGIRGRAAAAVGLTLRDVAESSLIDPFTGDDSRVEGGGLRAGSYSLALDGLLELRGTSYVSGVRIDGTVTRFGERRQSGKVRIDGPEGIDGVVRLRGRRFSGRVAGRQVSGVFRRSPASPARAATVRPHPVALPR